MYLKLPVGYEPLVSHYTYFKHLIFWINMEFAFKGDSGMESNHSELQALIKS